MAVKSYRVIASILEQTVPKPVRYEAGDVSSLDEFSPEVITRWLASGKIELVISKGTVNHGNR